MFIAFRKKARTPGAPVGVESQDYALKRAREVLIADDLESHRLFGGVIFVAPKEEVFESKLSSLCLGPFSRICRLLSRTWC